MLIVKSIFFYLEIDWSIIRQLPKKLFLFQGYGKHLKKEISAVEVWTSLLMSNMCMNIILNLIKKFLTKYNTIACHIVP